MTEFLHCRKVSSDSLIKLEENGKKAIFRNQNRLNHHVYKIDGCVIDEGERADFLVNSPDGHSVILELKGCNVEKACRQIYSTLSHPNMKTMLQSKIGLLIVCSAVRMPRADTFIQKQKQKFAKEFNALLHVKCKKAEVDCPSLTL